MSVFYGLLAAIATLCALRALSPSGPTYAVDTERLGAAVLAAVAVGLIVGLAA